MKKLLFILCLPLISLFAQAQHGADSYLDVTYQGYINGQYVFKLKSLQNCKKASFVFSIAYSNVTISSVTPSNNGNTTGTNTIDGQEGTFYFTGAFSANAIFTFQALTICDWKGSNSQPITVNTASTDLPVRFTGSPKITHIYEDYVVVEFTVAEESQIKQYNIQFSRDSGYTWQTVAVQIPTGVQMNKTYSINVKMSSK